MASPLTFLTSATRDNYLATAIGRFVQACAHIEGAIEHTLSQLLDGTSDMGRIVAAAGTWTSNVKIIRELGALPEIPLSSAERSSVGEWCKSVDRMAEHRNRMVHNRVVGGSFEGVDTPYLLIVHKINDAGTVAMPITIEQITLLSIEAEKLCIPPVLKDLQWDRSLWESRAREYPSKQYPVPANA